MINIDVSNKKGKVVITGANGFVGTSLCREFSRAGTTVIAVVKDEYSDISGIRNLENIRIVYCDKTQFDSLSGIINENDIDLFYHFAWSGTSGELRKDYSAQLGNVESTCDAVKACSDLGCKRFIYASSIMEIEVLDVLNRNEKPNRSDIYSVAKLCANYMGRIVALNSGVEYLEGMITNVYGPGEYSERLINSSLRKMINNIHCSFSKGDQLYDFVYIDDAARAFRAIGEKGQAGKRYYVGSSHPRPLKEFLIEMKDRVDTSIELGLGEIESRSTTIPFEELDVGALGRETGFESQVSFNEGILRTLSWIRENEDDRV